MPPWGYISWIILYCQVNNERKKDECWKYTSTQQFTYLMIIIVFYWSNKAR